MTALQLSAALSGNAFTAGILSGEVRPEGIELTSSVLHPSEMFWRQLRFGDFDVSEMSLSSLCISRSQGNHDWVALPIFTSRTVFHTRIVVRAGAGIEQPADLKGKRVGVPEYQQTAAVWSRGALQHEWSVAPQDMLWFMERQPSRSHGGATAFRPPDGVQLSYVPESIDLGTMLARGELDAVLVYVADRNLVDRTRVAAEAIEGVRTLFPDPAAEGIRYLRKTNILPANHCVVVRASVVQRHPWVPLNIYAAFLEAKRRVLSTVADGLEPWNRIGAVDSATAAAVRSTDPMPYGIAVQSDMLDALLYYVDEQGLSHGRLGVADMFAESVLDL